MKLMTLNQDELHLINEKLCEKLPDLLDALEIELYPTGKMLIGACPVHEGDNRSAFNLYEDTGIWRCRTHLCHKKFVGNLIGLIRAVLSKKQGGPISFQKSLKYALNFVELDRKDISKAASSEKFKHARQLACLSKTRVITNSKVTREKVRASLSIPSAYYQSRNYSASILDKYDVGDCSDPKKKMFNRAVVPVYDDNHQFMAGCTGRSVFDKHFCGYYHDPNKECPINDIKSNPLTKLRYVKWLDCKTGDNFNSKHYLYNYWYAKDYIRDCGAAILVEGAGDVWRFEEAGIHISLGMFGTELTDEQQIILERSGAMSLIVVTDNDEAGMAAAARIKKELGRHYRLYFPSLQTNDVGDMHTDKVTSDIGPIIDEALKVYANL